MMDKLWPTIRDGWLQPSAGAFREPELGGRDRSHGGLRPPLPAPHRPAREPVTVLLVEDDAMVGDVFAEVLSEQGYQVLLYSNGNECLRALPFIGQRVVLVTDVRLPGGSGRALADEFRRLRPGRPVVFATGLSAEAVEPLHGNETVLLKPFRMAELAAAVSGALKD